MPTVTLTLSDLIEETLDRLQANTERPAPVVVGANALADTVDNQLTVATGDETKVNVTDVLENGRELMLVTVKSTDPVPVFTVSRGYAGTTPVRQAAVSNSVLLLNPLWSRFRIQRAIERCFKSALQSFLPPIVTEKLTPPEGKRLIELPAETISVDVVRFFDDEHGDFDRVDMWEYVQHAGTASTTGQLLVLSTRYDRLAEEGLYVTRSTKYRWVTGGDNAASEADTIVVPFGAGDLPALYASAWMLTGREVSRMEIDRIEQWSQEAAIRQGVNLRMIRTAWEEFYRRLDETRRTQQRSRRRSFERRRREV